MTPMSRRKLVDLHLRLLKLEQIEEEVRERELIKGKATTLQLVIHTIGTKNGAYILTLRLEDNRKRLPNHCIVKGSRVKVSESIFNLYGDAEKPKCDTAVVTSVTSDSLTIGFSYDPDKYEGQTVNVLKDASSIENDQLQQAMKWVKSVKTDQTDSLSQPASQLVRLMFGENPLEPAARRSRANVTDAGGQIQFINHRLDASQRQAVEFTFRQKLLAIIHGPPGTGKTTTVVEVILQHVRLGQRVLVCAPSNTAVDNMLEDLWKLKKNGACGLQMEEVIRLGHLVRMDEKNRYFSLNMQVKKRMRPYSMLQGKAKREKEISVRLSLLQNAVVVMSTLTSVRTEDLGETFDLLVIDECAQATEAACWLAIPLAKKVLLSGDPHQLPPTILSQEAAKQGLAVSLMERQMALHGEDFVHMLDTQYRMHELIQAWSSRYLYGGRLKAAPLVGRRLLTELEGVMSTSSTRPTLLLVDTAGCHLPETCDTNTSSYRNDGEADLVVAHAKSLIKAGLPAQDIGVITPYKRQVGLIVDKMRQAKLEVEVNSVDGYQGREKEAVLLSLVRSNEGRKVGFVKDCRRLNVAVTRARRQLFIVCDTATVCTDKTIRSLVDHMKKSGHVRSAREKALSSDTENISNVPSATRASATSVSDTRAPAARVLGTRAPAARVLDTRAPAARLFDTGAPAARVLGTRVPATRVLDTRAPAVRVLDTRAPAARVLDTCAPAVRVLDTRARVARVLDTRAPAARVVDTRAPAARVVDTRAPAAWKSDTRYPKAQTYGTYGPAARVPVTYTAAVETSATFRSETSRSFISRLVSCCTCQ